MGSRPKQKLQNEDPSEFLGVDLQKLSSCLRRDVDDLISLRMRYVNDLGDKPSDDEINYLATISDLASQLRTAVILAERAIYFKTKI